MSNADTSDDEVSNESAEEQSAVVDSSDTAEDTDWQAEAGKWKELARKHEDRAKTNAQKAQAYDEYLESQKSEEEKRDERLTVLQSERDSALADAARYRAGLKYGLTDDELALLGAGEDFDERAKALAERLRVDQRRRNPAQGSEMKPKGRRGDEWMRMSL